MVYDGCPCWWVFHAYRQNLVGVHAIPARTNSCNKSTFRKLLNANVVNGALQVLNKILEGPAVLGVFKNLRNFPIWKTGEIDYPVNDLLAVVFDRDVGCVAQAVVISHGIDLHQQLLMGLNAQAPAQNLCNPFCKNFGSKAKARGKFPRAPTGPEQIQDGTRNGIIKINAILNTTGDSKFGVFFQEQTEVRTNKIFTPNIQNRNWMSKRRDLFFTGVCAGDEKGVKLTEGLNTQSRFLAFVEVIVNDGFLDSLDNALSVHARTHGGGVAVDI